MDTQGMVNRCASGPTSSSQVSAVVVRTLCEGTLYIHYHWKGSLQFIYPGVPRSHSAVLSLLHRYCRSRQQFFPIAVSLAELH